MSPTGDLPTMLASNYANSSYSAKDMVMGGQQLAHGQLAAQNEYLAGPSLETLFKQGKIGPRHIDHDTNAAMAQLLQQHRITQEEEDMPNARRIVQVYIADPNEDVPLESAVLYTGEQKLTDLTDQELFFEIDMKTVLAAHNAKRIKLVNKKVKDRTEYLEPARVRDLKMVVVTVASF